MSQIPGRRFEITTPCTVRGYHFVIEVYDAWSFIVFRDVARGYTPIATLTIPRHYQNDAKARNNYIRRVARHLLTYYLIQHKALHDGLAFLPASALKLEEMQDRVGLVRGDRNAVPAKAPEPLYAPEPAARASKRRRDRVEE